jgi:hypothetical protein
MTATCFGFLPKAVFRLWLRGFLIHNIQCLIYTISKQPIQKFYGEDTKKEYRGLTDYLLLLKRELNRKISHSTLFCSPPRRHIVGFKEDATTRQKSAVAWKGIKNVKTFPVRDIAKSTTEGLKISGSDAKIYHVIIIVAKYYKTWKKFSL